MEYSNKFKEIFKSDTLKSFIKTALQIKKEDKTTSTKLKILSAVTCVGMTALGGVAFKGAVGAVLFLIISSMACFSLTLSMKKKALVAYLKHYRENLLFILEDAPKAAKPDTPDSLNLLFQNTMHHWTVCYENGDGVIGFSRIYENTSEIANGCAMCSHSKGFDGAVFKGYFPSLSEEYTEDVATLGTPSDNALLFANILSKHFDSFALASSENASLLFLPTATDFMSGRVETKDDVEPKALVKQFVYFEISKAFNFLDTSALENVLTLLYMDLSEENEIYEKIKKSI